MRLILAAVFAVAIATATAQTTSPQAAAQYWETQAIQWDARANSEWDAGRHEPSRVAVASKLRCLRAAYNVAKGLQETARDPDYIPVVTATDARRLIRRKTPEIVSGIFGLPDNVQDSSSSKYWYYDNGARYLFVDDTTGLPFDGRIQVVFREGRVESVNF
jgi:hypothetical protein